jgi:hypothetical protein
MGAFGSGNRHRLPIKHSTPTLPLGTAGPAPLLPAPPATLDCTLLGVVGISRAAAIEKGEGEVCISCGQATCMVIAG